MLEAAEVPTAMRMDTKPSHTEKGFGGYLGSCKFQWSHLFCILSHAHHMLSLHKGCQYNQQINLCKGIVDNRDDKINASFPSRPMITTPQHTSKQAGHVCMRIDNKFPVNAADTTGTMTVVTCTRNLTRSAGTVSSPRICKPLTKKKDGFPVLVHQ